MRLGTIAVATFIASVPPAHAQTVDLPGLLMSKGRIVGSSMTPDGKILVTVQNNTTTSFCFFRRPEPKADSVMMFENCYSVGPK
ncbi:hypothetical protein [Bradyrhizobium sp. F1.13.3]|jgi:hypothetical protein|uniref:hypothetical protein n=1 Tax=Bradyrhizobium sp. F1.13.3 TaxID=3156351 RepID=UPI00339904B5